MDQSDAQSAGIFSRRCRHGHYNAHVAGMATTGADMATSIYVAERIQNHVSERTVTKRLLARVRRKRVCILQPIQSRVVCNRGRRWAIPHLLRRAA
eukprot:781294-Pyramimonas_sp.AAC.1